MKLILKSANFGVSMLLILAAIAIAYIAIPAFGNKALIVRSGSMQPTIKVGDLVVVQTQKGLLSPQSININKYKEGNIIAFKSAQDQKVYTTHRIVGKEVKDGKVFYQTKGDANNAADNSLVAEENIIGKSTFQLPYFGRLFAFAKSNIGFLLLVIFPALLVIILEMVNIFKEIKRQNRLVQVPMPKGSNFAGLKIIIPVFMSVMVIHNAFAYFSDTETSTGNIFTASSVFPSPTPTPGPTPTPSPSPSPTPSPTPPPIAQTLVMNELLPLSSCNAGQTNGQFLELWNGSGATVNLKDFKLSDGTNTIAIANSNTDLPNNAFAILVKSNGVINQCLNSNINGAVEVNLGGQLNLNTGTLKLLNSTNTIIDKIQFNGTFNGVALTPATDQSVERVPLGHDSVIGDNFDGTDFIVRERITPGYGSLLLLNELLPDPNVAFADEWVEIYNPSGAAVSLTGWTLKDVALTARSLTSLGPVNASGRVVHIDSGDGWLNNSGSETLQLIDNTGKIIDQHTYTGSSPDTSIGRENDGSNVWKTCTNPSKNATNNGSC